MPTSHPSLPITAVPWRTGLAGLVGFSTGFAAALALKSWPALALTALIGCTAAPMWWLEWRRHSTSRETANPSSKVNVKELRTWRIYGLAAAATAWAAALNVLPLADGAATLGFWEALAALWPLVLAGLVFYVLHPSTAAPTGLELLGRWLEQRPPGERFPWHVLRDQLVKAFFLPLMIAFAYNWVIQTDPWSRFQEPHWYFISFAMLYLIDTVFAAVGYLSTIKKLGAHIRSSNPYWLGWGSALICYPPFFTWLQQSGFNYRDGLLWSDWLTPPHPTFYAWGFCILSLSAIYVLSTVVFGIRFSNLTNRGIITHGPYRWTKHPAYISKNLSWWLISVPFISNVGATTAALHCAILICINAIYWLRAKTEELHLMHDPDYRAYSTWIEKHGLFSVVCRTFKTQ